MKKELKRSLALTRNWVYLRLLGIGIKMSKWAADKAQSSLDKAKELI